MVLFRVNNGDTRRRVQVEQNKFRLKHTESATRRVRGMSTFDNRTTYIWVSYRGRNLNEQTDRSVMWVGSRNARSFGRRVESQMPRDHDISSPTCISINAVLNLCISRTYLKSFESSNLHLIVNISRLRTWNQRSRMAPGLA